MAIDQEFRFLSADGSTELYGCAWLPQGQPKAVLQIIHGISEYVERYDHMARYFTERGFVVVGDDHLGHGHTPATQEDLGYTADEDGWVKMTDNVHALYLRTKEQYPDLPYVLLGHSMGSFLSRSYLIRYPSTVDACILMGTGQQPEAVLSAGLALCAAEEKRLGKRGRSKLLQKICFGTYNRQFKPNRTTSDWVCSVSEVVDRYMQDPFCQAVPTVALMRDMLEGIRFNQQKENLAKMDPATPIFFVSGEQDPVGNNGKGVTQAYQSFRDAGCDDVRMKLYPGCRHEVHNESVQQELFDELYQWIRQRLPV